MKSVFAKRVNYGSESKKPRQISLGSICYNNLKNELVMGGGLNDATTVQGSLGDMTPTKDLWFFSLDKGIWGQKENFTFPKELMGCSLLFGNVPGIGSKLYVFGGIDIGINPKNKIRIYDFETAKWSKPEIINNNPMRENHYILAHMFFTDQDFKVVKVEDSPSIRYLGIFGMGLDFKYLFYFDILEDKFLDDRKNDEKMNFCLKHRDLSVFGGLEVTLVGQNIYTLCNRKPQAVLEMEQKECKLIRINLATRECEEIENSSPPKEILNYKYVELLSYKDKYVLGWGYAGVDMFQTAEEEEKRLGDRNSNLLFIYDIQKGIWRTCRILSHVGDHENLVVRRYLSCNIVVGDLFYVYGGSYCGVTKSKQDQLEFRDMFYFDLREIFLDEVALEDEKERKEFLIESFCMEEDCIEIKFLSNGKDFRVSKVFATFN